MFIISDVHGDVSKIYKLLKNKPFLEKHVILLGDIGYGFPEFDFQQMDKLFASMPTVSFYVVQGNHDNADMMICNYPNVRMITTYTGAKVHYINSKAILLVPGAFSYDKNMRVPGVSWWENEQMTDEQYIDLKKLVDETRIDIVLSHDTSLQQYFNFFPTTITSLSNSALDNVLYRLISSDNHKKRQIIWVHGHLHYRYFEQIANVSMIGLGVDEYLELF